MADRELAKWRVFEEYARDALTDDPPTLYRLNRLVAAGFNPDFNPKTPDCVWLHFKDDKAGVGSGILYSRGLFVLGESGTKDYRFEPDEGRAFEDHIRSLPVPGEIRLALRNAIRWIGVSVLFISFFGVLALIGVGLKSFIRSLFQ